jgi:hypothetical protein
MCRERGERYRQRGEREKWNRRMSSNSYITSSLSLPLCMSGEIEREGVEERGREKYKDREKR